MSSPNHLPKLLSIALLFGAAALMPAFSLAQSAQDSPLPKAPPEIMSKELRDPRACARQSAETTGQSFSEQLARSDGVICPPPGVDSGIRAPTPEGGRMPVISPPGSPGGELDVRPK